MKLRTFKYLLGEGFKNVWSHRLMSVASAGVLMACMLMMGIVVSITYNIDNFVHVVENQAVVMTFFEENLPREDAIALTDKLSRIDNVKACEFISREDGLKQQRAIMGDEYDALFDWVAEQNPLPDCAQITIDDLSKTDQTVSEIKNVEGVWVVRQQQDIVKKLSAIRSIINIVGVWVILLLLVIALVIVSNTIKITMFTRKLEINIMKAVGATNRFIRMPFVVEGMTLGVIAGLLSTGLLYFIYKLAERTFVSAFSYSGMTGFVPFTSFAFYLLGAFVLMGAVVGSLGSAFSIGKYLRHEGSEFNAIT